MPDFQIVMTGTLNVMPGSDRASPPFVEHPRS